MAPVDVYVGPKRKLLCDVMRDTTIKSIRARVAGGEEIVSVGRDTILQVPEYQEVQEIGEKGDEIHLPELVGGPMCVGLHRKPGIFTAQEAKYPEYAQPTLSKQGLPTGLVGRKVGFVPYQSFRDNEGADVALLQTPRYNSYLPRGNELALTQMVTWKVPEQSPEGNPMVEMFLDQWQEKYGTTMFRVDEITGQIYASKGKRLEKILEICVLKPIVG